MSSEDHDETISTFMRKHSAEFGAIAYALRAPVVYSAEYLNNYVREKIEKIESAMLAELTGAPLDSGLKFLEELRFASDVKSGVKSCSLTAELEERLAVNLGIRIH